MADEPAVCGSSASDVGSTPAPRSSPAFLLKPLICDQTFGQLESALLPRKGRGRHPDPPHLKFTNRLLLQLRVLQQENHVTKKDVECWYGKLFPKSHFPTDRLSSLLSRAEAKVKSIFEAGGDLSSHLDTQLDLDFICISLEERGIKLGHLLDKEPLPAGFITSPVTHELVLDLLGFQRKEHLPKAFSAKWVRKISGCTEDDKTLICSIEKLKQCFDKLNVKKQPELKSLFLATVFKPLEATVQSESSTSSQRSASASCALSVSSTLSSASARSEANRETNKLSAQNAHLTEINCQQETEIGVLKETVCDLSKDKVQLVRKAAQVDRLQGQNEILQAKVHQLRQNQDPRKIQRLQNCVKKWRDVARGRQSAHNRLIKVNAELKAVTVVQKSNLQRALRNSINKVSKLKDENEYLKVQLQELTTELNKLHAHDANRDLKLRTDKNRFCDNVRQTCLQLMGNANVPPSKCSTVIQTVARHLFQVEIQTADLPCQQTAINIADEGHFLSKYETAEKIVSSSNFTLHSDGTSRSGNKIVGHQISLDCGTTLSLGFSTVACEDANTLLETAVHLLEEICDVYTTDNPQDRDNIFNQILEKMTSVMSDRAPVMKSFDRKLQAFLSDTLGREVFLHFLHCNAHFLLGLSRSCEQSLKFIEKDLTEECSLGRDKLPKFARFKNIESATSRLLRLASDVTGPRGDDKNGIRAEWLAYCAEHNVKSCIVSFKNNRFNCFFKSAAAVLYHRKHLQDLFDSGCLSHTNSKLESVSADCRDIRLLCLVCAVALVYLNMTGPFWNLLESDTPYTDLYIYIQQLETCVERWRGDASEVLDPSFVGIFDGKFEIATENEVKEAVYGFAAANSAPVKSAVEIIMRDLLIVTRTQLSDFLSDGKYSTAQSEEVKETLRHCPITNLLGENVFGEMDFNMAKSRHASFHHHSTTQMLRHNKTSDWLWGKTDVERDQLMQLARRKKKELREHHRRQEKLVQLKVQERLLENQRQKRLKEAKLAAQRASIVQKISAHGGPCVQKQDVDRLVKRLQRKGVSRTKIRQALLNEVRYQKQVLNEKGTLKLSGTQSELINSLMNHLPGNRGPTAVEEPESSDTDTDMNLTNDPELTEDDEPEPFSFSRQGQWLAVYYDQDFYIGQVIEVKDKNIGVVQFLEKTTGRADYFRWPRKEDVADVKSDYVIRWDFEVLPVTSDGRVWQVPATEKIKAKYHQIATVSAKTSS